MERKVVSRIMLTLILGTLTSVFAIQPVKATGTIHIRADGTIAPSKAPIYREGDVYTLTDDIYDSIVVERNNIVIDGASHTVQGAGTSIGIDLSDRSNVTVKSTQVMRFRFGMGLFWARYSTLIGNTVSDNYEGIQVHGDNNILLGNNIFANDFGISLSGGSNNTLANNAVSSNNIIGIYLFLTINNTLVYNTVSLNWYGIQIDYSSLNKIFNNNFINNTRHVYFYALGYSNNWDDGYPSGGNYWNNYTDVDLYSGPYQNITENDGIWDHPYIIDANNIDNYPLVEPWGPKTPSTTEALEKLIQTVESWNLGMGIENSLISTLQVAYRLLNLENQNAAKGQIIAFMNKVEALRLKKLTTQQVDQLTSEAQRITDLING